MLPPLAVETPVMVATCVVPEPIVAPLDSVMKIFPEDAVRAARFVADTAIGVPDVPIPVPASSSTVVPLTDPAASVSARSPIELVAETAAVPEALTPLTPSTMPMAKSVRGLRMNTLPDVLRAATVVTLKSTESPLLPMLLVASNSTRPAPPITTSKAAALLSTIVSFERICAVLPLASVRVPSNVVAPPRIVRLYVSPDSPRVSMSTAPVPSERPTVTVPVELRFPNSVAST